MSAAFDLKAVAAPVSKSRLRLGMAQLSPWGLSEQWLLRECGDRHWALIATASGQQGTAFRDKTGRPIYAAFCATSLNLTPITEPLLAVEMEISSRLYAMGPNRLGSIHTFTGPKGTLGQLLMISCFLCHDETGSNRRLMRSSLPGLGLLAAEPQELTALNARARQMARAAKAGWSGPRLLEHKPVPALDFNAAKLLYFPTFSKISEMAAPSESPLQAREIVYLGNIDPGEIVYAQGDAEVMILQTLSRPLAMVRTVSAKTSQPA